MRETGRQTDWQAHRDGGWEGDVKGDRKRERGEKESE